MSITYRINPKARLAVFTGMGVLAERDFLDAMTRFVSDPDASADQDQLFIFDNVDGFDLSFRSAERLMSDIMALYPDDRPFTRKAVSAPGASAYSMSRLFQKITAGNRHFTVALRRSVHGALDALGRTPADLRAAYGENIH